jgi:cytoskeletal protein RodZ
MARHERGVYEPSDEVRVFDGAEDDEDDAEGSRLPLLIVLALVVLCAFAGVVWLAYTQGVARGRTETPVLAAAPGPERTAPTNEGAAEVPYQGFKIYEQPAPADTGDTEAAAPAEAPAAAPAPKPAPPAEFLPQQAQKPAPAPVAARPAPVTPPPAATAKPAPVTPPPPTRTAAITPPPATAATGAPRTLPGPAPAKPAPTPPPAPAAAKPAAAAAPAPSGSYVLQIGAFKSQAEADAAWKVYSARHAALVKGYSPNVQAADLGEKGTWYRLRITGFADRDVAAALCDRLKAQSGACILGR